MSWNSTDSQIVWPEQLVWSASREVQSLLSDVPLIATGVLGLACAMLLVLGGRQTKTSPLLLCLSTLLGFSAGFFHMLSLLQGENNLAELEDIGTKAFDVLANLSMSLFTGMQLVFFYVRFLQLNRGDSIRGGAESMKTQAVLRGASKLLNHVAAKSAFLLFIVAITGLEAAWRVLLSNGNALFIPVFLASNTFQLAFMLLFSSLLLIRAVALRNYLQEVYSLLPLLAGAVLYTALLITSLAVNAFVETPLGRLMIACIVYIWLIDSVHENLDGSATSRDLVAQSSEKSVDISRATMSSSNDSWRGVVWTVTNPSRDTLPSEYRNPGTIQGLSLDTRTASPSEAAQQTSRTLSFGPVIRRGSRLPSWLLRVDSMNSVGTAGMRAIWQEGEGDNRQSRFNTHSVQGERSSRRSSLSAYDSAEDEKKGNSTDTEPLSNEEAIVKIPNTSAAIGQGAEKSAVLSPTVSSAGTYDAHGTRLDSPMDLGMRFSNAVRTSAPSVRDSCAQRTHRTQGIAGTGMQAVALPNNTYDGSDVTRSGSTIRAHSSSTSSNRTTSCTDTPAEQSPDLSRYPSYNSQESSMSLSRFPRPPSYLAKGRPSFGAAITERWESRNHNSKACLEEERHAASAVNLLPPRMPAAAPAHQHSYSWESNDTLPGSLPKASPPEQGQRGLDVTSFIGASASPEAVAVDIAALAASQARISHRGAQILRASSLTRQSAKLLVRASAGAVQPKAVPAAGSAALRESHEERPNTSNLRPIDTLHRNTSIMTATSSASDCAPPFYLDSQPQARFLPFH